jgi:hypothetical protein
MLRLAPALLDSAGMCLDPVLDLLPLDVGDACQFDFLMVPDALSQAAVGNNTDAHDDRRDGQEQRQLLSGSNVCSIGRVRRNRGWRIDFQGLGRSMGNRLLSLTIPDHKRGGTRA